MKVLVQLNVQHPRLIHNLMNPNISAVSLTHLCHPQILRKSFVFYAQAVSVPHLSLSFVYPCVVLEAFHCLLGCIFINDHCIGDSVLPLLLIIITSVLHFSYFRSSIMENGIYLLARRLMAFFQSLDHLPTCDTNHLSQTDK